MGRFWSTLESVVDLLPKPQAVVARLEERMRARLARRPARGKDLCGHEDELERLRAENEALRATNDELRESIAHFRVAMKGNVCLLGETSGLSLVCHM